MLPNWTGATYTPPRPRSLETIALPQYDVAKLVARIDWTPFFRTWELAGNYPQILEDDIVGGSARSLFNDAKIMLQRLIDENWLTANGVLKFFPAYSLGDDIEIYSDESRDTVVARLPFLRQQMVRDQTRANLCLADFIAPSHQAWQTTSVFLP